MPIILTCGCGKKLTTPDEHAGLKATCNACGATVAIPDWVSPNPPAAPASPPPRPTPAPEAAPVMPWDRPTSTQGSLIGLATAWRWLAAASGVAVLVLLFVALVASGDDEMTGGERWANAWPWLFYAFDAAFFALVALSVAALLTLAAQKAED